MRALLQRVSRAEVRIDGQTVGAIGHGLLVLLGVAPADGSEDVEWMASKLATLRIFADDAGKMNLSVLDVDGEVLLVSQFTLFADAAKGRRPSFATAAAPAVAEPLVGALAAQIESLGVRVATGEFGARMEVELVNDGPVTLMVESP